VTTVSAPTSRTFTDAVALRECEAEVFDRAFTATTQPCPWPKAYGGDMVAQALVAAGLTIGDGKAMHSMHSYFMRPVDIGAEVRYEVEVLRDGRGYSTRQVRGFQNGKPVYVCLASFAAGEPSGSFRTAAPVDVPAPESLPTSADYLENRSGGTMTGESKVYWSGGRSFDMRHVPGPVYLTVEGTQSPHQAVWVKPYDALRPVEGLPDAQRDTAALAYVCDYTILEPALRVLGLAWADEGLVTASLDHAMWWRHDGRMDEWVALVQDSPVATRGTGLGTARLFSVDGLLLASVVQEGLVKLP
jgi:acyl-CoA thioesterase-2